MLSLKDGRPLLGPDLFRDGARKDRRSQFNCRMAQQFKTVTKFLPQTEALAAYLARGGEHEEDNYKHGTGSGRIERRDAKHNHLLIVL
jgi:hypothetical protein